MAGISIGNSANIAGNAINVAAAMGEVGTFSGSIQGGNYGNTSKPKDIKPGKDSNILYI